MATFSGTSGNDTFTGGTDVDSISGQAGNDTLYGLEGADSIYGGDGSDSLFGGADDDLIRGGAADDFIDGGDGIDTLDYTGSTAGVLFNLATGTASGGDALGDEVSGIENLIGSGFADTLTGDTGNNMLTGGAGNDELNGGLGADTLYGGLGDDIYVIDNDGDVISEIGGGGVDYVYSSVSHTLQADFEILRLTGTASINGIGNALANALYGNNGSGAFTGDNLLQGLDGNDTIYGYNGADTLDGGTGNDSLVGGAGSDLYVVDSATDAVIEMTGEGEDTVEASISYTLTDPVTNNFVEHVTLTGTADLNATGNLADNRLTGNTGNNQLFGNAGKDTLTGGDGNDTLNGGAGNDSMNGGAGDDTYHIDNTLDKTAELSDGGIDTVISAINNYGLASQIENLVLDTGVLNGSGNSAANTLTGNALDNLLDGEGGDDTLIGGAGGDTLDGGSGVDTLFGGAGDDVYRVDNVDDVADESAVGSAGVDRVETKVDYTLGTGIENGIAATNTGDIDITGNDLDNTLTGSTQDNILLGMAGTDSLYGGDGEDTLNGGEGADVMVGGAGNDVYQIDSVTESITELALGGTDTVEVEASFTLAEHFENLTLLGEGDFNGTGNAAANILIGNGGANTLSGGAAKDSLSGGAGNDSLDGGTEADSMVGGLGDDIYVVDNSGDKVVETSSTGGIDLVQASVNHELAINFENLTLTGSATVNGTGNALANTILGNAFANLIKGETGADTLTGLDGDDTLDGGSGADSMTGGAGNDTYVIDNANDVIAEAADEGTDTVISSLDHTLADAFENLTLSGTAGRSGTGNGSANVMTGNSGSNRLQGLGGADTLVGGAGKDTLDGGTGADEMTGGVGNDVYIIDDAGDVAIEAASAGIDTLQTVFTTTLGANFENVVLVGSADLDATGNSVGNRLTGTAGNNILSGLDGNDSLFGGAGNDELSGDAGNDSMVGGAGDDTYYVDSTTDKAVELSVGGFDQVFASANFTLGTGLEDLVMQTTADLKATGNTKANTITGNGGDNEIKGSGGADTLFGNGGADTLNGGAGNDSMTGGAGNDLYLVNARDDVVVEVAGGGIDTVSTTTNWQLSANVENLVMASGGSYRGTGNGLDNQMTGNKGNNTLSGMAGDDTLNGGLGNDVLTGGAGTDEFVFSQANSGNDTITDFNAVNGGDFEGDLLVFAGLEVGTFVYLGDAAFSGGSDNSEARFDAAIDKLLIDVDGDGAADFRVTLTGMTDASEVGASDFLWS